MKTTLSKLFAGALATVILALSAIPTLAQPSYSSAYGYASLSLAGIGTTAGATTQTVTNQVLDVRGFQNVSLQTKFAFSGSTTSNVVYLISKSIDKVIWETVPSTTWTVAGTGTTPVVAVTTIATGGVGWLRLESIQNTHATLVLTNTSFAYSIKRQAP